jgi:murein DD-endopeptidase MepM/ murein hydrolase activator NlpD
MAPRGTPLVAVANGVIRYGSSVLGGNTAWLHSDYGVSYFYAHLDAFAADLGSGDTITIGTVIGTVGDTGNPAPGAYHLHFGIFPGGTIAVNPYPSVRAVC